MADLSPDGRVLVDAIAESGDQALVWLVVRELLVRSGALSEAEADERLAAARTDWHAVALMLVDMMRSRGRPEYQLYGGRNSNEYMVWRARDEYGNEHRPPRSDLGTAHPSYIAESLDRALAGLASGEWEYLEEGGARYLRRRLEGDAAE